MLVGESVTKWTQVRQWGIREEVIGEKNISQQTCRQHITGVIPFDVRNARHLRCVQLHSKPPGSPSFFHEWKTDTVDNYWRHRRKGSSRELSEVRRSSNIFTISLGRTDGKKYFNTTLGGGATMLLPNLLVVEYQSQVPVPFCTKMVGAVVGMKPTLLEYVVSFHNNRGH